MFSQWAFIACFPKDSCFQQSWRATDFYFIILFYRAVLLISVSGNKILSDTERNGRIWTKFSVGSRTPDIVTYTLFFLDGLQVLKYNEIQGKKEIATISKHWQEATFCPWMQDTKFPLIWTRDSCNQGQNLAPEQWIPSHFRCLWLLLFDY